MGKIYTVIRHPVKDGWTWDDGECRPLHYYRWSRKAYARALDVMLYLHDVKGVPWQSIVWPFGG